jgi:hypothetical protein
MVARGVNMLFLGIFANCMFLAGGLFKSPRVSLSFYSISNGAFFLIYLGEGLLVACISLAIITLRNITTIFLNDRNNMITTFALTAIASVLIVFQATSPADTLILFAGLAVGYCCLFRDDFVKFRILSTISQALWIMHCLIVGVYAMMICNLIILATNLWIFYKHSSIAEIRDKARQLAFIPTRPMAGANIA